MYPIEPILLDYIRAKCGDLLPHARVAQVDVAQRQANPGQHFNIGLRPFQRVYKIPGMCVSRIEVSANLEIARVNIDVNDLVIV